MSYRGKVILCGNASVGKTSLLARYVDGKFDEEAAPTIGANFLIKEIEFSEFSDDLITSESKLDDKTHGYETYIKTKWKLDSIEDKIKANRNLPEWPQKFRKNNIFLRNFFTYSNRQILEWPIKKQNKL